LSAMRQSLLFSGLEAISFNINRRNSDLKLFEFGKTYHKLLSGNQENSHLTLFATGNKASESWTLNQKPTDFFLFKAYVLSILNRLGLNKVVATPLKTDFFAEGMVYEMGNSTLVEFGTIKKSVLKHFDIKQEVFFADFNWNAIIKSISNNIKYTEIPKYQEVRRDLALLIDNKIEFAQLYELAKRTEKTLLKSVDLFDVYQGDKLPKGKKSYAMSFIMQDNSKTLTDSQIDKVMSKLAQNFETELGATLR
jgi:phenylalanyl-tRNA synthetase beta chain